jgi:hypothetical protein
MHVSYLSQSHLTQEDLLVTAAIAAPVGRKRQARVHGDKGSGEVGQASVDVVGVYGNDIVGRVPSHVLGRHMTVSMTFWHRLWSENSLPGSTQQGR